MENKSTKWNYRLVFALGVLGCRKTLDITKLALDTRKSLVKVAIIIILTVGDNSYGVSIHLSLFPRGPWPTSGYYGVAYAHQYNVLKYLKNV